MNFLKLDPTNLSFNCTTVRDLGAVRTSLIFLEHVVFPETEFILTILFVQLKSPLQSQAVLEKDVPWNGTMKESETKRLSRRSD